MESIKSVQENPFFKHFGIRHNIPPVYRTNKLGQGDRQSLGGLQTDENDDIGEYRPVSGFVHKLLDKFSSLSAREEQAASQSILKRSTSLDESEVTTDKHKVSSGTRPVSEKPSYLLTSNLSHRARSIDSLNHLHHKPQQRSHRTSLLLTENNVDKIQKDLDPARRNIVIIEKTPSTQLRDNDESKGIVGMQEVVNNRDAVFTDELPKPNTVFTVRSIFESASSGTDLYSRRQKSEQPLSPSAKASLSPLRTEITASGQISSSKRGSIQLASPITSPRHDVYVKPVLLPNSAAVTRSFDCPRHQSDSYLHSKSEDVGSLVTPITSQIVNPESPRSPNHDPLHSCISISDSNSTLATENKSNNYNKVVDTAKYFNNQYSTHSQRSTASVRPTVNNKLIAPVKPVPLSPPASSTTSYQKSRPVVSVAPYKDKPEDNKDHDQPVMIFSTSKLRQKGDKPQRDKDYSYLSDIPKEIKSEEKTKGTDIILSKEGKKHLNDDINAKPSYDPGNKVSSQGSIISDINIKNAENKASDKNRSVPIKHQTTVEVRNIHKEKLLLDGRSTDAKNVVTTSKQLTKPTRMAPEPPINHEPSKNDAKTSISLGTKLNEKNPNKSPSYDSTSLNNNKLEDSVDSTAPSKQSHSPDSSTVIEQPVKKAIKEESEPQELPIKGIPSIIAQRLKKQNSSPSQAAQNVVTLSNTTVTSDCTSSGSLFPRSLLSPTRSNIQSSSEKPDKDALSSEIENEIAAVRRKMEANRLKADGPAQIFDSSQLTKKKKEQQAASVDLVPHLDLSDITGDFIMEYQPPVKKIQPCNIVFIGENAKTSRSLLVKRRTVKINIHFNDLKPETFEYPSEETALEKYLEEHPHEKEEILVLENFGLNGDSSDDVEVDVYVTPNETVSDSLLKANTGLAHSGNLQSYRGRFQEEYVFGSVLIEQPQKVATTEPAVDPDKMMLRPAEEDVTNIWSTNNTSDLLF